MSETNSKPVTMVMFNLYEQYIKLMNMSLADRLLYTHYYSELQKVQEIPYFIQKLDETRYNPEIAKYFQRNYLVSDLIDNYSNHIDVLYDGKYDYKSTVVKENEKGKIIREIFFNPNNVGSYLYRFLAFDKDNDMDIKRLTKFFEYGLYDSIFHEDMDRCKKAYADLSDEGLKQYKRYIDTNINCLVMTTFDRNADDKEFMKKKEYENWRESMLRYGADYRVDAYDRACELEKTAKESAKKQSPTTEKIDDEERE